jgi:hypothetical protein
MSISRTMFAAISIGIAVVVAGCGGKSAPPAQTSTGATTASGAIDACKLISPDDIAKLLGNPVAGRQLGNAVACTWENKETYESITLEIGNPGTAVNNLLPPADAGMPDAGTPGPDGMRMLASGMVEFPAGGRSNTVQVAVLELLGQDADNAAIDLARKVGPQLPAQ